jgi:phage baseplate assembly protein W
MTQFAFPFRIDATGRIATVDHATHVRQLIEQILLTIPGERVNRPTFGSAAHNLIFPPNDAEHGTTVQYLMQSALQQWLGDVIAVQAIQITSEDSTLRVTVQYILRRTQDRQVAILQWGGEP